MIYNIHTPEISCQFNIDYDKVRQSIKNGEIYTVILVPMLGWTGFVIQLFVARGSAIKSGGERILSTLFGVPNSELKKFGVYISTLSECDIISIGFNLEHIHYFPDELQLAILMNIDRCG